MDLTKTDIEKSTAILMGRTQESVEQTIGSVIFVASFESEANKLMNEDPAVKHGLMSAELVLLRQRCLIQRPLANRIHTGLA